MVALPYLLLCLLVTTWAEKAPTSPPVKDYQVSVYYDHHLPSVGFVIERDSNT